MAVDTTSLVEELARFVEHLRGKTEIPISAVYLFGSATNFEGMDEHSDVDLAVFSPIFNQIEVETIDKLFSEALKSGLSADLAGRLEFHLYPEEAIHNPNTFVREEVLKLGLKLFSNNREDVGDLRDLLEDYLICPKCSFIVECCGCNKDPNSQIYTSLFLLDPRWFSLFKSLNWMREEIIHQDSLGLYENLELALVAWSMFDEYATANIRQRLLLNYDYTADAADEIDSYFLKMNYAEFAKEVCNISWEKISADALAEAKNSEFEKRREKAKELRNSFVHGRLPYIAGKLPTPGEIRDFCRLVLKDLDFLFKPTADFAYYAYGIMMKNLKSDITVNGHTYHLSKHAT
ncbi:MAG: hypothetical protein HRF49_03985 [bacterium]|jgi:predicted nucleotidyltransferase